METIGIIGVGKIGLPIAENLIKSGYRVLGYRRHSLAGQPTPDRRQFVERRAIHIHLPHRLGGGVIQSLGAGEMAIDIVETAIFRVDHHNRINRLHG